MIAQIDAGAVIITGLFGNTGPQLRNLFMNKGSGSTIHQGWYNDFANDRVCTYPAYWVILANHKQRANDAQDDLPYVSNLVDVGGTSSAAVAAEERPEERPFASAMLPVEDVPQWTGCVDVPGSAVAGAKKIVAQKLSLIHI